MKNTSHYIQRAFTLLELIIAVAILGITSAIAVPSYREYMDRADVAQAIADIYRIDVAMASYEMANNGRIPVTLAEIGMDSLLDPWENPYQYLNISTVKGKGKLRKDHNLVPINSDYDLYSMGKDGRSVSPLTAKHSRDDIIRASNGRFVGKATDF